MLFCVQANALESLSYSGRLVQTNGAPVSGTVNLRAELAYTNSLGTILCSDDIAGVVLLKGVFHVKLDFACTGGKTLTQVLSQAPANESVAIQITDVTNSKSYSFQAIHAIPYANVASIAAQLAQLGAADGEFLKWNNTTKKWEAGGVTGASGGTVTNVTASLPISISSGTTTPDITIAQANTTTSGYLSAADWNSFNSKQGSIAAGTTAQYYRGDKSWQTLDSSIVPENVNLYFTNARALGVPLTGFVTAAGAIVATDTTLAAFEKAQGQINAINSAANNFLIKNSTDTVTGVVNVGTIGLLQLAYVPVGMNDAVNKSYADTKLNLTGGTLTGVLTVDDDLRLKGGSNHVTVKGHATSANYDLTLPQTAGTAGYVLSTDGSGNTSWVTSAVGSSSITDGSIVDADVNASAGIAQSKIAGLTTDLAGKVSTTLSNGNIFVGNGSNIATAVSVSGDATLVSTGALTLVNSGATAGTYKSVTVDAKGRVTAGSNPTTLAGYGITDTLVTSITVTAPITKTGTAAVPILAMPAATTSVDGYLSTTDWNTFNNKQAAITSASNITTGSITTTLQNGVNLNPYGVAAGNTGELRFYELTAGGSNYTSIKGPDALGANINYVLPSTAPTAGQVLSSTAGGVMSWITIPSAPVSTVFGRSGAVTATAGDYTASQITYSPAGNIAATTIQAALDEIDSEKQGLITAGTTSQYFRGDKTFVDFGTDVRSTPLTTFAVGANSTILAADTTLAAFGKVQGQINATNTAVGGKEPTIATGTTAQYIRGDKTLSTFATDAINSVLATFALNGTSKPSVSTSDSVVGAFGKVQKFINDINSDYVSKSANQTINGSLAINSVTGFITVPTPINPTDAANKSYVDSFGQWTVSGANIYRPSGSIYLGQANAQPGLYNPYTGLYNFGSKIQVSGLTADSASASLVSFQSNVAGPNLVLAHTRGDTIGSQTIVQSGDEVGNISFEASDGSTGFLLTSRIKSIVTGTPAVGDIAANLVFQTRPAGGALADRMKIDSNGNVGIGNSAPGYILDIAATTPTVRIKSASNDATGATLKLTEDMVENGGFLRYKSNTDTMDLGMLHVGVEVPSMSIVRANGNVGVGTSTPTSRFEVQKVFNGLSNTSAAFVGGTDVGVVNSGLYIMQKDGLGLTSNTSYMMNAVIDGISKMVVTGLGNVGIGSTNPNATLQIAKDITTQNNTNLDPLAWNQNSQFKISSGNNALSMSVVGILNQRVGIIQAGHNGDGNGSYANLTDPKLALQPYGGSIGIGTTSPQTTLDVLGTFRSKTPYAGFVDASISNNNTGYGQMEILNSSANTDVSFLSMHSAGNTAYTLGIQGSSFVISNTSGPGKTYNDIERFTITNTGNVGIGTTAPATKLNVVGSIAATDWVGAGCEGACEVGGGYALMYADGHAVASVGWQVASDKRLKTDITPIDDALEKILKINGVQYHLLQNPNGEKQTGLIAQNVQTVFPDLATKGKEGFLSLDYSRLVSPIIESIKEFYSRWTEDSKDLHTEIAKLKSENTELKEAICEINSKAKICASLRKPASKK
jgi:hypothetical protein